MLRLKTVGGSSVLANHSSSSQLGHLGSLLPSSEPAVVAAVVVDVDEFVVADGGSETGVVGSVALKVVLRIAGLQSKEEGSAGHTTGAGVCSRSCQRRSVAVVAERVVAVGRCNFLGQKEALKRCFGLGDRSVLTGSLTLKSRKEVHQRDGMRTFERNDCDRSSDLVAESVRGGSGWEQMSGEKSWRLMSQGAE